MHNGGWNSCSPSLIPHSWMKALAGQIPQGWGSNISQQSSSFPPSPAWGWISQCHTNCGEQHRAPAGVTEFSVTVTRAGPALGIVGWPEPLQSPRRGARAVPGPCQGLQGGSRGSSRGRSLRVVAVLRGLINSEQRCLHTPLTQHLAKSNTAGRAQCASPSWLPPRCHSSGALLMEHPKPSTAALPGPGRIPAAREM